MVDYNFNPSDVPEQENKEFDAVPQGTHQMMITDSKIKKKADSGSEGLDLTCKIVAGPFENRLVWTYVNLVKKDGTPNDMGKQTLAQLCRAIGLDGFSDTTQLHNAIFSGTVKHSTFNDKVQASVANFNKPKDLVAAANGDDAPPF